MFQLPHILNLLNAKLVAIFAIATGILIFLFLPTPELAKLRIQDPGDGWRTSVFLIDLILWCFLFSKLAVSLFRSSQKYMIEIGKQKIALNYLEANQTITVAEVTILVRLKLKNETHFFSAREHDEALLKLCAKGLVIKTKWCRGVGQEYVVPKYIWTSKQLKILTEKYRPHLS